MHDSHIHLALEPLKSNIDEIVKDFVSDNGKYILTQSTDLEDFRDTLDFAKRYPKVILPALGFHPTIFEETILNTEDLDEVKKQGEKYLTEFENIFRNNVENINAVGETGLDYFQSFQDSNISEDLRNIFIELQKESFKKQIELSLEYDLPLSIHCRELKGENRCVRDALEILASVGRGKARGSFHSYTGDIGMVDDILDMGFYIGFNAVITYPSGEDVRDILRKVPEDRVLFETDGPFLPPQSIRKNKKLKEKYATPFHVREIINIASEVMNMDSNRLESVADENFEGLFIR